MTAHLAHPLFGLDSTSEVPIGFHHAVGSSFAMRYLSRFTGKVPSRKEVLDYRQHGIHLAVVFEDGAKNALGGHGQGVADARFALGQADFLGMPKARPIFFAVDYDTAGNPGATDPYFDGVASVMGKGLCGPYGGVEVCTHQLNRGFHFAWQTYAWSRGFFDGRCQVYQFSNDHSVGGVGVDYNRAFYADFGQWDFHYVPPPPPDPMHYLWYPTGPFPMGTGKQRREINERATVEKWDQMWRNPNHASQHKELRALVPVLFFLRSRIWYLVHDGRKPVPGKHYNWNFYHRGWRFQELFKRSNDYDKRYGRGK